MVFGGDGISRWLTLWLSLQLTLEDLHPSGTQKVYYDPIPGEDMLYWQRYMNALMWRFPDDDMEFYLPQLVAVLLRKNAESRNQQLTGRVAGDLGALLQDRCRSNHNLGMQLIWQLRAAAGTMERANARTEQIETASLLNDLELATKHGNNLPDQLQGRRKLYHRHSCLLVDTLVGISLMLRQVDHRYRLAELQAQLAEVNRMLLRRMHTRGKAFEPRLGQSPQDEWLDERSLAEECPEAARFALPLPLRVLSPGRAEGRSVMKVLRVVRELCGVLPSRERAPFMVVCEVLQTNIRYGSDRLYVDGGVVGVTAADMVQHRTFPKMLQEELAQSTPGDEWASDDLPEGLGQGALQRLGPDEGGWLKRELEDQAFFQRAFEQYLTRGGGGGDGLIQRMRLILTRVFDDVGNMRQKVYRQQSPFGRLKGWRLAHFIVKAGDDVRQEHLAMQVIELVERIFRREGLPLWLRPYALLCCGDQAGLVECITDAKSIDHIKKQTPQFQGMQDMFERMYMGRGTGLYGRAQDNFVRSLAGYSIITYMLQVKDRHNGNIMLDCRGHIIHIDFGFILGSSPGLWRHETAPFKLTQDYLDIMGGEGSPNWWKFRDLFLMGFRAVQRHIGEVVALVKVMVPPTDRRALVQIDLLRRRFEDLQTDAQILALIDSSLNSRTTRQYDVFQSMQNGITM